MYNLGVLKLIGLGKFHFRIFKALLEAITKLLSLKRDEEW